MIKVTIDGKGIQVPAGTLCAKVAHSNGFHSIRINAQWRIIFKWTDNNAAQVSITDYH